METIKSYTDVEQSKKLAEILPLESADMWYHPDLSDYPDYVERCSIYNIPCWSLAALLGVLPTKLQIALVINDFQSDRKEKYAIGSVEHDRYDCFADNPIDVAYELIIRLNELNLL